MALTLRSREGERDRDRRDAPTGLGEAPGLAEAPDTAETGTPAPSVLTAVPDDRPQSRGPSTLDAIARPARRDGHFYLTQTATLGWNGSVVTGYGYAVVGMATSPTARTGANGSAPSKLPAPPPRRHRRRRMRRRVARYDDQIRHRRRQASTRPVEVFRVRRVVRRVNVWSLARFALLVYLCVLAVFLTAAVGLWELASRSGAVPNIESFVAQLFAFKVFRFHPRQMLDATLAVGLIWVFLAELMTVTIAVIFNLVSDVVGGVEFTILEEMPIDRGSRATKAFGFLGLSVMDPGRDHAGNGSAHSPPTKRGNDGR